MPGTSDGVVRFDDTIDADIPCAGCGYNLRSLTRHGNCPECGKPKDETLPKGKTVHLYQYSPKEALRTARRNTILRTFFAVAGLAVMLAFFGIPFSGYEIAIYVPLVIASFVSAHRNTANHYAGITILMGGESIVRLDHKKRRMSIDRAAVRKIASQLGFGFTIVATNPPQRMFIPRSLPNREHLRQRLVEWGKPYKRHEVGRWIGWLVTATSLMGSLALVRYTTGTWGELVGSAGVLIVFAVLFRRAMRDTRYGRLNQWCVALTYAIVLGFAWFLALNL